MRRLIIIIMAMTWLVVGYGSVQANAAKPGPTTTTVVMLDVSEAGTLPAASAAAAWSKNTDVTVKVGACVAGLKCIHLQLVENTTCQFDNPLGVIVGCAFPSDGYCTAQVDTLVYDPAYSALLPLSTSIHEIGHCLGLPHNPNRRSIMNAKINAYDPISAPSPEDKRNLAALY